MNCQNKRVVCINGDKTKLYDQVIFIMKESMNNTKVVDKIPIDFVKEAENIINGYKDNDRNIKKREVRSVKTEQNSGINQVIIKKSSTFDIVLNFVMLIFCAGISLTLLFLKQ